MKKKGRIKKIKKEVKEDSSDDDDDFNIRTKIDEINRELGKSKKITQKELNKLGANSKDIRYIKESLLYLEEYDKIFEKEKPTTINDLLTFSGRKDNHSFKEIFATIRFLPIISQYNEIISLNKKNGNKSKDQELKLKEEIKDLDEGYDIDSIQEKANKLDSQIVALYETAGNYRIPQKAPIISASAPNI